MLLVVFVFCIVIGYLLTSYGVVRLLTASQSTIFSLSRFGRLMLAVHWPGFRALEILCNNRLLR